MPGTPREPFSLDRFTEREIFGDGKMRYVATIVPRDGGERDFTFNGDGTLASMELPLSELPAPIAAAVKAQAAQGGIGGIDKTFEDGETTATPATKTVTTLPNINMLSTPFAWFI